MTMKASSGGNRLILREMSADKSNFYQSNRAVLMPKRRKLRREYSAIGEMANEGVKAQLAIALARAPRIWQLLYYDVIFAYNLSLYHQLPISIICHHQRSFAEYNGCWKAARGREIRAAGGDKMQLRRRHHRYFIFHEAYEHSEILEAHQNKFAPPH